MLYFISSSVARKAPTRCVGRFCMKPTVSVSRMMMPEGRRRRRMMGSSVQNSLSSASTPASVRRFKRVDLPGV